MEIGECYKSGRVDFLGGGGGESQLLYTYQHATAHGTEACAAAVLDLYSYSPLFRESLYLVNIFTSLGLG